MNIFIGTSGFSYKEWKGKFYPQNLPDKEMLRFYSHKMSAVEINNTFYRMPGASVLKRWAEQVPPGFRFVIKAPRAITHNRPLEDKGEAIEFLYGNASLLGDKLGAILFQLPPYFQKEIGRLAGFADILPSGTKAVFEFRHPSWFDSETYRVLHDRGLALCHADREKGEQIQFVKTAEPGYLRLHRPNYTQPQLLDWIRKIKSQGWQEVFVFFKHEEKGAGPEFADKFLTLAAEKSS